MVTTKLSLKARALRYLSQREHSRLELARKLSGYAQTQEELETVLDFLEAQNWLSSTRFVESLVRRRGSRFGNAKILYELSQHGIEGAALKELEFTLLAGELQRAQEVWQRKFGKMADTREERMKQARFLEQRGFSRGVIRTILQSGVVFEEGGDE